MNYNLITLVGRVGAQPDVRVTGGGITVSNFSLITNYKWTNSQGVDSERTDSHRIVAWRGLGEIVRDHVRTGRLILVTGRVQYDRVPVQNGDDKWYTKIIASEVRFMDNKDAFLPQPGTEEEDDIPL